MKFFCKPHRAVDAAQVRQELEDLRQFRLVIDAVREYVAECAKGFEQQIASLRERNEMLAAENMELRSARGKGEI